MFSNASVKRLLQYRKSNGSIELAEAAWSEKAVRSLVKKLKNQHLNHLEIALATQNSSTRCVCVPRWVNRFLHLHGVSSLHVNRVVNWSPNVVLQLRGIAWKQPEDKEIFIFNSLNHSMAKNLSILRLAECWFPIIACLFSAFPFHHQICIFLLPAGDFLFSCLREFCGSKVDAEWFTEINWIVLSSACSLSWDHSRSGLWHWVNSACNAMLPNIFRCSVNRFGS